MAFTNHQAYLLKACKGLGYGYALFAASVERQGHCTPSQEATLSRMQSQGEYRKNNWTGPRARPALDIYFTDLADGGEW